MVRNQGIEYNCSKIEKKSNEDNDTLIKELFKSIKLHNNNKGYIHTS